jgi:hypothetical protein
MKLQEVFKKTGGILKELNEQYQYLETSGEHLNDLELELFVANAHFLTDHAEILRKLNMQQIPALPPHQPEPIVTEAPKPAPAINHYEQKHFEPVVQQAPLHQQPPLPAANPTPAIEEDVAAKPVEFEFTANNNDEPAGMIDLKPDETEDTFSYERKEPETIRHELTLDEGADWEEDEENDEVNTDDDELIELPEDLELNRRPVGGYDATFTRDEEPELMTPEPEQQAPEPHPVIADTTPLPQPPPAEDQVMTLNQRISAQMGQRATDHNQTALPIKDLKSAINLNDKLLYVKDLFNGYSLAYSEAIEILNRFTNFDEADRFLKANYTAKNKWEDKQATADKFYSVLKRRFA